MLNNWFSRECSTKAPPITKLHTLDEKTGEKSSIDIYNFFTDHSKAVLLEWVIFCYSCFVFVILSCLFIAVLWSPAGKGQKLSCM